MKSEKGTWAVTRTCCISGSCMTCRGSKTRPVRIIQGAGYSEAYAKFIAENWSSYQAKAVSQL
jgi:hypothetical protein